MYFLAPLQASEGKGLGAPCIYVRVPYFTTKLSTSKNVQGRHKIMPKKVYFLAYFGNIYFGSEKVFFSHLVISFRNRFHSYSTNVQQIVLVLIYCLHVKVIVI